MPRYAPTASSSPRVPVQGDRERGHQPPVGETLHYREAVALGKALTDAELVIDAVG